MDVERVNGHHKPTYSWGAPSCSHVAVGIGMGNPLNGPSGSRHPLPQMFAAKRQVGATRHLCIDLRFGPEVWHCQNLPGRRKHVRASS